MANSDEIRRNVEKSVRDLGNSIADDVHNFSNAHGLNVGNNGTNALVSVIITIIFGPLGAFCCWWLFAKYGFIKSLVYFLGYVIGFFIAGLSCYILIGFILVPLLYIYMIYKVYKAVLEAPAL